MLIITNRTQLRGFAATLGVRPDWHEPDEQDLTARVEGTTFDNAGFWPLCEVRGTVTPELHVVFSRLVIDADGVSRRGEDLAAVNLATLCSWATGGPEGF